MNDDIYNSEFKLGITPTLWTNDDWPFLGENNSLEDCLKDMSSIGYKGCEAGVLFGTDPEHVKPLLKKYSLQMCNKWFDFKLTTEPFEENLKRFKKHMKFTKSLGAKVIGGAEGGFSWHKTPDAPILMSTPSLYPPILKGFYNHLNELGKIAADQGIQLCYHPHIGTIVQNWEDTERLLDATDPEFVLLNFDTAHYFVAGEDPVAVLKNCLSRVGHIHLKDVRKDVLLDVRENKVDFYQAIVRGIFDVPGYAQEAFDFGKLLEILIKSDFAGWIVVEGEQDPSKVVPVEIAGRSYQYIHSLINQISG